VIGRPPPYPTLFVELSSHSYTQAIKLTCPVIPTGGGRRLLAASTAFESAFFRDVSLEPQPNSRSYLAEDRRTTPEMYFADGTVRAWSLLTYCCTSTISIFSQKPHPARSRAPCRAHLFLPETWVVRSPIFSSWPAAWFASVPVWPPHPVVHLLSSQPAQAFL